jgi:hypothetical protein
MICSRCGQDRPESDFNGLKTCSKCKDYLKRYYVENRGQEIARALKSYNGKYKKDPDAMRAYKRAEIRRNPESYLLYQTKTRAKKRGLPFNLTHDDVKVPEKCPVLGYTLEINSGGAGHNSPTVDRIVPSEGYVKGNVQIISHRANTIKSDATAEELRKVADFMEKLMEKIGHSKRALTISSVSGSI